MRDLFKDKTFLVSYKVPLFVSNTNIAAPSMLSTFMMTIIRYLKT